MDLFRLLVILGYYIRWLKYIYLYASAGHLNIVWFDYIVANYVTVIPHGPTGDTRGNRGVTGWYQSQR